MFYPKNNSDTLDIRKLQFILSLLCTIGVLQLQGQTCLYSTNNGFESGMTGWTGSGTAAGTSVVTTSPHSGTQCARMNSGYECGIYQSFTGITGGTEYRVAVWARTTGTPNWAGFGIDWYDASWNWISNSWNTLDNTNTTWDYNYQTITAPANAANASLNAYKSGTTGQLFVDDFCLSVAPSTCGLTISLTDATDTYTKDGKILVEGITAANAQFRIGPENDYETTYGIGGETFANAGRWMKGLAQGNHTIYCRLLNANYEEECLLDTIVNIGAGTITSAASTEINGTVYGDYNANGQRDVAEKGITSVTINAYDSNGTLAGNSPVTTNSDGLYTITGLVNGADYRLEFSWTDSWVRPGAFGVSETSVQFTTAGTSDNNMGLNYPADYCHTNDPYLVAPCYVNGDVTAPAVAPFDALVAFPRSMYSTGDMTTQSQTPVHAATAGQVGSAFGEAYQKTTETIFLGAFLRRFMGFGPLGTGGIYAIDFSTPTSPTVSQWIDLNTIGIATGTDPRDASAANSLATTATQPVYDAEAYNQVGKIGIGGLCFNSNNDTLWFINLYDKKLYAIKDVDASTTPIASDVIGGYTISLPSGYSCSGGTSMQKPFAVRFYKGKVYVGLVCSGETSNWNSAGLHAFVLSFDPTNPSAGFSHEIDFPMGYSRNYYNTDSNPMYSWSNNSFTTGYVSSPMFTDIEFDVDGSMILVIGDRGGYQTGYQNYRADPTATNTTLHDGNSYGEIKRVCNTASGFVMEGNAGCPLTGENITSESEYYWGDLGPYAYDSLYFRECAMGGAVNFPMDGEVIITAQDPSDWYSGGLMALSNRVGSSQRRTVVYDQYAAGGSGKATGIGDVEILCNLAPIEVGERIFTDYDGDGIQDAGEPGIPNIIVGLYLTTGNTFVAYDTTDAAGHYVFKNLDENTGYTLRVDTAQTALANYFNSTLNAGSNDLIDNDGAFNGANQEVSFTTYRAGYNDHSFDFGFRSTEICEDGVDNDGDGLVDWADPDCQTCPTLSDTSQVAASADDAEENLNNNSVGLTSSDLELGQEGSTPQMVGMRFNTVNVPQGAKIYGAYIEFETDETPNTATSITFWGEAADNARIFADSSGNLTGRATTSDSINWNSIPQWTTVSEKHNSPDLSPIIQEIVDRSGWAADNSIVILATGTGSRIAESYDGENANAPKLVILYEDCNRADTCFNRVQDGIIAAYNFEEKTNPTVYDVSGVGSPLNLTIRDTANVTWSSTCGLALDSETLIESSGAASKLIDSIKAANAISVEVWLRPENTTQNGPARIVSISEDPYLRNFTLGQQGSSYAMRLRTSTGNNNGFPSITAGTISTLTQQHVVYTWDGSTNIEKLYVNNFEVYSGTRSGDLSNWDDTYALGLGNELTDSRDWLGELYYVGIYNKALSSSEIDSNYQQGFCCNLETALDYDCYDGVEIELQMAGIEDDIPYTMTFADTMNIDSIVVEVVYKNNHAGDPVVITDDFSNSYSASPISFSTNAFLYRFTVPLATSTITYADTDNDHRAQSMVAYIYRNGQVGKQYVAQFTTVGGYNNIENLATWLPARTDTQNIRVILPISEVTYDNRHLTISANVGNVSTSEYRLWGPSGDGFDNGCCVDTVHLYLKDVPPDDRLLTVQIDATGGGQSYIIGATVYVAIACNDEVCDNGIDDDLDGLIDCDDPDCNPDVAPTNTGPFCPPGDTIQLFANASPSSLSSNLVYNGEFGLGNTGFSTDYDTWAYGVADSTQNHWSWAPSCSDYSGVNNLMVADGRTTANQRLWYQTVTVQPNTDYNFSVQAMSFWNSNHPIIRLNVNGTDISSADTIFAHTCNWQQSSGTWNSGAATSATIAIYNDELASAANDFAIDNVFFGAIPSITNYSWTGPASFTSTDENPTRSSISTAMGGVYHITVTSSDGCTASDSTDVYVSDGVEICANGLDDDCDGFIDCYDLDCPDTLNGGSCPTRFNCDNMLYQTLEVGGDYWFYLVETSPSVNLVPKLNLTAAGVTDDVNATILSPTDGYVYFIELHEPYNLWRLDGDLNLVNLGAINGFPTGTNFFPNAAGVGINGEYYVRDPYSGDFYTVDIATVTASLHCAMTPFGTGSNNIGDFAYNPIDGKYYGYRDSTQTMYIFDPSACSLTPKPMESMINTALGSFYFSADGVAYGYENGTGYLYQLDVLSDTVRIEIAGQGAPTFQTDGCSCDGVKLTKEAPDVCAGDTLTIEYNFSNLYRHGLDSIFFSDTLTDGLTFITQPYDVTGNVQINSSTATGNSTIAFVIDSLTRGSGGFKIDVAVPASVADSTIISQNAWMKNLPNILGNAEMSDDPTLPNLFDPTDIVVYKPALTSSIDNASVCEGADVQLSATGSDGKTPYTYAWTGPSSYTSASQNSLLSTVTTSNTGTYTIVLTDSLGCTATDSEALSVVADPIITAHPQNDSVCAIYGSYLTVDVSGGIGPFTYDWQYNNGGSWEAVTNNTPATVIYSNLNTDSLVLSPFGTAGLYEYRVLISDAGTGCSVLTSNIAEITVSSVVLITQQPENDSVCVDAGHAEFTFAASQPGYNGKLKFEWQYNNGGTWEGVANGNPTGAKYKGKNKETLEVDDISVAGTYDFRVEIDSKEFGCDKSYTAIVTLLVAEDPAIDITGATTICTGGTATLNATEAGGAGTCDIQWQSSPNGTGSWSDISGATNASYTTPALTTNTWYRAVYSCTGDDCDQAISNVEQVTIVNDPSVNITGGNVTVCDGGNVVLTASVGGGTDTISYQWQDSSDGTTFTNISGATAQTYNTGALSQTTYYQVLISFTGNGCESSTSTSASVTVVPDPTVSVTGADNVCTDGSVTLTATTSGGTGTCSLQWQYLNGSVWLNLSGETNSTYTTPNLTATTQYRARYLCTGGGCDLATSNTHTVTVNTDPTVSVSTPTDEICTGGTSTLTATVSGGTGTCTIQWQSSANGTSGWADITGENATTFTTPALLTTTYYRVLYTCTGTGCDAATSNTQTITVLPDPTISVSTTDAEICTGGTATLTATTSGGTGTCTIQWQSSPNGTNGWSDIVGETSSTYTTPVLTTTSYYRAVYTCAGEDCFASTSNVQTIIVVTDPSVNITGGDVTICTGGNVVLTASVGGGSGTISYQWQDSPDGTTFTNISGATAQTYNTGALTQTTHFQVLISFSGNGCESSTSTSATINVVPDPTVTVSGEDQICTGGSVTLTATTSGGTGTCSLQWQYYNTGVWLNLPGETSSTYTTPNLTTTTQYRSRYTCTGGGCDLATATAHTVTVNPDPTVTISVPNNEICEGGGVILTATPSGGLGTCTLQWQSSPNGTTWTDISGENGTTYTTPALSANLFYQATYECDRAGCCD